MSAGAGAMRLGTVVPLASALALASASASAQTPLVPWNPESTETPAPPPQTPSPVLPAPHREPPVWTFWQRSTRIAAEVLGASVGVGLAAGAGYGLSCAVGSGHCRAENFVPIAGALSLFGLSGGVTLAGELMGARGGFGWSLVGELGGGVLAVPLALLAERRPWLAITAGVALPLAGAIVGYEVSAEQSPASRHRARTSAWAPSFAVSPDGASVGVVGAF